MSANYEKSLDRRLVTNHVGVTFPLLSDFKRQVVKDYGIYYEAGGYASRATFTIDKNGIIRHIEQGKDAIDPTGAYQSCSTL